MSASDRAAHLERLNRLELAATSARTSRAGFEFAVDLERMPLADLKAWAKAEQGCCSFLRIRVQVPDAKNKAMVRVTCPAKMKGEVMSAFGLKS